MNAVSPYVFAHGSLSSFFSGRKKRTPGLNIHLLLDVVKGIGGIDGEADQDDVGVGV
jgi:hypothetical protein